MTKTFSRHPSPSYGKGWIAIPILLIVTIAMLTVHTRSRNLRSADPPAVTLNKHSSYQRGFDFEAIGLTTGTDKVRGPGSFYACMKNITQCQQPAMAEPKCRTGIDHYYHTMYNARLGPLLSGNNVEPFQMLEIGFQRGHGHDAFKQFMPKAEVHSLEISCLPPGPREEGKWPFENLCTEHENYQQLIDSNRLHCGDATDYDTLVRVWRDMRQSPNAPPLKLVIDDGSHISEHMAKSVFFWFPRLEPGGLLVMEDIEPIALSNAVDFRKHFLPQVFKDVHYCGDPASPDQLCFPTIHKFMQSVHCEMHICIFERNNVPAEELSKEDSLPPPHTFDAMPCLFNVASEK